ncbi:abortive infection protein [Cyanobium sp. PCC 7001]|uniref:CPBP family intramembrane glutamic endopeptidase n=1 Tax=Cyanobium sp. PCC 7001 TaxID=180281 RepID=UPI0001805C09|nr:abortive infection protein [Cyanobium sp. PCC 7001]
MPALYGTGWLLARPLSLVWPTLRPDQVDLAGLAAAMLLLVIALPWRVRRVWGQEHPWRHLGIAVPFAAGLRAALHGLQAALLLITLVTLGLLVSGQAVWVGELNGAKLFNGLALGLGVGVAEELLFRGWLWGELALQLPARSALLLQATIFALIHPWYRLPGLEAVGQLGGLILLGLVLACQRRADRDCLWGAVALHGGLVGGWFLTQHGLLTIAPDALTWWVGPGGGDINPTGGLLGWAALGLQLWAQRRWWSRPSLQAAYRQGSGPG